jgi:uncharacterized iron-regulated membrane protein
MNAQAQELWRVPSALVRAARSGHSALGLSVATFLYVVVLAGSLLMFVPELDYGQQRQAPVVDQVTPALANQALAELPGGLATWRQIIVRYPSSGSGQLILSARHVGGETQRFAVDAAGALQPLRPAWSDFLKTLHERLTLPGVTGEVLVGLLGVALLTMLIGGVLSYPRMFRDAFLFRAGAPEQMQQADLHHRLGAWALPFHLAIGFSGAMLALALPVLVLVGQFGYQMKPAAVSAALLGPSAGADRTPAAAPPDLESILHRIDGENPATVQRIVITNPGWQSRLVRVDIDKARRLVYGDQVFFDAGNHVLTPGGILDDRPGLPFYSGVVALHFGTYGGTPLRIAYGLLGLALCVIVSSGVRQWLALQRARGRPRPRVERLWAGWIWGCVLALVVSYDGMLVGGPMAQAPRVVFGIVVGVALLTSLVIGNLARLRQLLRGLSGTAVVLGLLWIWI